uniref:Uncharacterized protein n=1 Tax=Oryza barthii TaxID=65489 RepID=A0A0D3H0K2_9ORYZ
MAAAAAAKTTTRRRRRGVLDLEAQFAFFRSQHRHPVNAAAHALLARALAARLGFALAWKAALATQLFCWTWQGPAVGDLPEVFLMEPFLILLQILNKQFGYEPYPGFSKNVDKKMEAILRENREELKQRKAT